MKRFIKINQRGDTIIEVLIAVAVIGFILSASYAVANRSTQGVRKAQERSEALKFSEAQLEKLKLHLGRGNTWPTDGVCILPDQSVSKDVAQCRTGAGNRYAMSIDEISPNLYNLTTTWEKIGGGTTDVLAMFYRIHDKNDSLNFECTGTGCDGGGGGGPGLPADRDDDGVPDASDACPDTPADTADGCPAPACSDFEDNDSDGLIDSDDPGCSSNQDTSEAPAHYAIAGANFVSCLPLETWLCVPPSRQNTGSVYNCQEYLANYVPQTSLPTGVNMPPGRYAIQIDYKDANCGAPTPPDNLYQFRIDVTINGKRAELNGDDEIELKPSGGSAVLTLDRDIRATDVIQIRWRNNSWVGGVGVYDPDFQINRLVLVKQ